MYRIPFNTHMHIKYTHSQNKTEPEKAHIRSSVQQSMS